MQEGAQEGKYKFKGKFKAGYDDRRHNFTNEECRRGYAAAEQSLEARFPGRGHFLLCAIVGAKPWHTLPEMQALMQRDEPLSDAEAVQMFARE